MTSSMDPRRHKYEYDVDLLSDTAAAHVVRLVGAGKQVLEVGAGPGSIARMLKEHGGCRVTAIERDQIAIAKLAEFCEHVYRLDLDVDTWPAAIPADTKFDVIVAADVLEHLADPWKTLRAMTRLMADNGCMVVSLPHIAHNAVIAALLSATFDYQDSGLLDRTHVRFLPSGHAGAFRTSWLEDQRCPVRRSFTGADRAGRALAPFVT